METKKNTTQFTSLPSAPLVREKELIQKGSPKPYLTRVCELKFMRQLIKEMVIQQRKDPNKLKVIAQTFIIKQLITRWG